MLHLDQRRQTGGDWLFSAGSQEEALIPCLVEHNKATPTNGATPLAKHSNTCSGECEKGVHLGTG